MMNKNESYIFGILITDGSLYLTDRNRGRVTLEISIKDEDIIDKLVNIVPFSKKNFRKKITNFSNGKIYSYVSFKNYKKEFRDKLISCGYPVFDKTNNAAPPKTEYDKMSFWRGVIDGDGSVGITSKNEPFVSLVTKSELLKNEYLKFLYENFGIVKNIKRNKRDNVYNIVIKNKNAIDLVTLLYNNNEIHLNRKYEKAMFILENFQY